MIEDEQDRWFEVTIEDENTNQWMSTGSERCDDVEQRGFRCGLEWDLGLLMYLLPTQSRQGHQELVQNFGPVRSPDRLNSVHVLE